MNNLSRNIIDLISKLEDQLKKPILDLSMLDKENKTLLIIAAKTRQWNIVKLFIKRFSDRVPQIINAQDDAGKTALHYAALYGESYIVQLLIQAGAKLDLKDAAGRTAFDCTSGDSDHVKETLLSIEIHPYRSCSASVNAMIFHLDEKLIEFSSKHFDYARAQLRMSAKNNENAQRYFKIIENLEKVVDKSSGHILSTRANLQKIREFAHYFMSEEEDKFYKSLNWQEQTVLDFCINNQKQVRTYLLGLTAFTETKYTPPPIQTGKMSTQVLLKWLTPYHASELSREMEFQVESVAKPMHR